MNLKTNQIKIMKAKPKSKYLYNSQIYDLNDINLSQKISSSSFDQKLGVTRIQQPSFTFPEKIKSKPNFSIDNTKIFSQKISNKSNLSLIKTHEKHQQKQKNKFKLPQIKKSIPNSTSLNPQSPSAPSLLKSPQPYYQAKILRALVHRQSTYMINLSRQHFLQSIEAIKIGRNMKLPSPKQIKLSKKNPKFKTIFLDLDQTLIHCDQNSSQYTVRLNFPIEGEKNGTIVAGIRVRPFCHQFLRELAAIAQIIIFTASAPSYADVVLDYLDPEKRFFSHRLYRQHCTLQRGFYTKDLRIVNRRAEDIAIVDNSAFSFMTQPEFGIPILPFYHFAKDKQLPSLLQYLRKLIQQPDMRQSIKRTFFWDLYKKTDQDPRQIFRSQFEQVTGYL